MPLHWTGDARQSFAVAAFFRGATRVASNMYCVKRSSMAVTSESRLAAR